MGRSQYTYEYPEVHPPHPRTQYPAELQSLNTASNSRFSWMDTTGGEPVARRPQLQTRSSTAPPLPVIPDHLHSEPELQHRVTRELSMPQLQVFPPQQQHPQQAQLGQQHQYQYLQQQPLQHGNAIQSPTTYGLPQVNYTNNVQPQQQQQPQQPLPQPSMLNSQSAEPLARPDPVKETPDHPNYRSSIAPDENPLTPTSPMMRNVVNHRQNTNMSVMPPTPSDFNFTNYAPVPQSTTRGPWSHSLCSCSEPSICLTGLFCPCILYGRTQYKLDQRSRKQDSTNMLGHETVNGSCLIWAVLCGVNGILSGFQKTRLRKSYELDTGSGSVFTDCMEGCCCCCCVLARNAKEIKCREDDNKKTDNNQGYVPPSGMTFAPPPR